MSPRTRDPGLASAFGRTRFAASDHSCRRPSFWAPFQDHDPRIAVTEYPVHRRERPTSREAIRVLKLKPTPSLGHPRSMPVSRDPGTLLPTAPRAAASRSGPPVLPTRFREDPPFIGRSYFPDSRWAASISVGPPFKPCMPISGTRLTGGLSRGGITLPPGIGRSRAGGAAPGDGRSRCPTVVPRPAVGCGPCASP